MTLQKRAAMNARLGPELVERIRRQRESCAICEEDTGEPLYRCYDASEDENCLAHTECAEDAGLEAEGEPI